MVARRTALPAKNTTANDVTSTVRSRTRGMPDVPLSEADGGGSIVGRWGWRGGNSGSELRKINRTAGQASPTNRVRSPHTVGPPPSPAL
jgi:hypothetical protein